MGMSRLSMRPRVDVERSSLSSKVWARSLSTLKTLRYGWACTIGSVSHPSSIIIIALPEMGSEIISVRNGNVL